MNPLQHESRTLPRLYVSRPRLLHQLFDAIQCKLAVVCADAGYGKTTLVADFVASARLRTEWYHLAPPDRDVTRLAEGLAGALERLGPGGEGATTRRARRHTRAASAGVLTEVLLGQTTRLGSEPMLLVLDDYQNVDQEGEVQLLLRSLIENSPSCLHFIVLSRGVPRFLLARLGARQELSILREEELAFTLDETRRFFREESGLDLDDRAIELIQERTEGWAAGIAMVSQSLTYGRQEKVMAVLADPAASAWLVYDYLAEEVFDRQEPAIQDFLVKTSLLGKLTAPICDHLMGTASSQLTLLTLEERGLFTTSVDPSKQTFRYHQLFREYLRQKLYQREPQDAVRALHREAAHFYERVGDWEEMVHHCLRAKEWLEAARAVEAVGERYIYSGFFQTVQYWLQALPEEVAEARPWLLALKGQLAHMALRYEDSLRLLERAWRLFQADGDREGQAWTAGERAFVMYRSGRLQQSIHHFASAIAMAEEGSMLMSQLLIMRASTYREAGMLEESLADCRASAAELAAVDDARRRLRGQSRATRNLGMTLMERGNLESARHHVQDALAFCQAHQVGEYEETWCLAMLGATLWACGEIGESIRVLNRALSLSGRYIRYQQHFIGYWLGNALRDSGRYAEAEQAYSWGTRAAELERVYLDFLTGRGQGVPTRAFDLYREYRPSESAVVSSIAEVVMGVVLRELGEPAKGLEHLREAVRLLNGCRYGLRLASALLHQARLEYELSRPSDGRATLAQAFHLASEGGYYHFFWWDPELAAFLCQKALAEGIFVDYATDLATRRLGGESALLLAPLLQDRRAEVRRRALGIVSSQARGGHAFPAGDILPDCGDPGVRCSLLQAIKGGVISLQGIRILRAKHRLSWREVEVLVEYYLRPAAGSLVTSADLRSECAQRLNISENTVRCHVNNLRSKLALPAGISGKRVVAWAAQEGLLPTSGTTHSGAPALLSR